MLLQNNLDSAIHQLLTFAGKLLEVATYSVRLTATNLETMLIHSARLLSPQYHQFSSSIKTFFPVLRLFTHSHSRHHHKIPAT